MPHFSPLEARRSFPHHDLRAAGAGAWEGSPEGDPANDLANDLDCGFLSRFGRSEESTEWFSPAPPGYQRGRTRFVAVIGTVMSGLGKGIFSSSLAKLIQDKGL